MAANFSPRLAHMGIACIDIDTMIDFYTSVFNLVLTEEGEHVGKRVAWAFVSEH